MLPKYSKRGGAGNEPHVFLSSSDCYVLRCALFHEGREEITEQHARKALNRFHFNEPSDGMVHCNQMYNVLQLRVDIFCNDVLKGLRKWVQDVQDIPDIRERIENILKVYPYNQVPGIIIAKKTAI